MKVPYDAKTLHEIKFYDFAISGRAVQLKFINWMEIYCISPQHQAQNWASIKLKSVKFLFKCKL